MRSHVVFQKSNCVSGRVGFLQLMTRVGDGELDGLVTMDAAFVGSVTRVVSDRRLGREARVLCCADGTTVEKSLNEKVPTRRRKRVGLPKGVGHEAVWYSPSLIEGSFEAGSGALGVKNDLVVLGIETSCDDTAAAVVRADGTVLGEAIASQNEIHEQWGGVVPNLAKEAHAAALTGVVQSALERANVTESDLDAVAVTMGPGLEICLRVGFNEASDICKKFQKPFVAVNHLEGHCSIARMLNPELEYPYLVVLVSGGHCQILVALGMGRYKLIGGTLDDAIGEAYDKTARLLGLQVGGGGGPAVEKLALEGDERAFDFPIPMRQKKNCNLSYAGLKNAVRLAATSEPESRRADIAASFQRAAIDHLIDRVRRAMQWCGEQSEVSIRSVVVCGGVAANQKLRQRLDSLCLDLEWDLIVPPPKQCTDNGAMIAWAGIERIRNGILDDPSKIEVVSRWPLSTRLEYR